MSAEPLILGISSAMHNGSACLVRGSRLLVAVQEERLTRVKRAPLKRGAPSLAVDYCLAAAGVRPGDLDLVVDCSIVADGEDPFERARSWPVVQAAPSRVDVYAIPHHLGHAYSAFCTSGFRDALVLVIDGGGSAGRQLDAAEHSACARFEPQMCEHLSIYHGRGTTVAPVEKHLSHMPYVGNLPPSGMPPFASLGHMFSSVSWQLFGDYHAAGKVMALASFADPDVPVDHFVTADADGLRFPAAVAERYRDDVRWPERAEDYARLSASVQRALEVALRAVRKRLDAIGRSTRLCYAGGVALNGVANRRVLLDVARSEIHIVPAADDAGPAIGAAYYGLAQASPAASCSRLRTDALGRRYNAREVDDAIARMPGLRTCARADEALECAADLLAAGKLVGWHQGGAEFGPRALGSRNILCDPRLPDGQDRLNRVKRREPFRPFAPAVLAEHVAAWFDVPVASRAMEFMLDVCRVRPDRRAEIPAVVHVDGTARAHTVDPVHNAVFYDLIRRFHARTGVPMVVSTSMNVSEEPIVETPQDALWLLLATALDALVVGHVLVTKASGFRSILDLRPVRTGRIVAHDAQGVRVAATSPHGPVEHRLDRQHADWLLAFDGRTSGRALLERDGSLEAPRLELIMRRLFRWSLIDLHADADASDEGAQ